MCIYVPVLIAGEVGRDWEYENVMRRPGVAAAAALATTQRIRAQPECNAEITSTPSTREVTPFLCATQMNPVFFSLCRGALLLRGVPAARQHYFDRLFHAHQRKYSVFSHIL
jgi:hypothetical protein